MGLLKEVAAELIGMFFGDAWLTLALLLIVAVSGGLIRFAGIDPLVGGIALALGCPALLIANLYRQKSRALHR
jgi:hypothetical protein